MIVLGNQGYREGPYLAARGWDASESREYEVYEYKYLGEVGVQPATPVGIGSLVEVTADNDNGVTRWRFRFETVKNGSGATAKRVRGFTTETPIYKHKDFQLMFAWYGLWIDRGRVTWKSYNPGKPKLKKNEEGKLVFEAAPVADFTKASPMAGVQIFHEGKIEVEKTKVIFNRSVGAFNLGKINRPAGVGATKKKKWIKSGIRISPRGNGYAVSEFWLQNNTNKKVYWPIDYDGPVDQGEDEGEEDEE
jgi:hypothetical protein